MSTLPRSNRVLARAFRYNAADLQANRAGRLSRRQTRWLWAVFWLSRIPLLLGLVVFSGYALLRWRTVAANGVVLLTLLSLIMAALLFLVYRGRLWVRDLRAGLVVHHVGTVRLWHRLTQPSFIILRDQRLGEAHYFAARWWQCRSLQDGRSYHLYALPRARVIIAAEVADAEN